MLLAPLLMPSHRPQASKNNDDGMEWARWTGDAEGDSLLLSDERRREEEIGHSSTQRLHERYIGLKRGPSLGPCVVLGLLFLLSVMTVSQLAVGAPLFTRGWGLLCPSPEMILPPTLGRKSCVTLPAHVNAADWTVQLCTAVNHCNAGTVVIQYLDKQKCAVMEETRVWEDEVQEVYVKARGPHTLMVIFDGAERWGTEEAEYMGECRYRFPYQLHNAGQFFVRVKLIHTVRIHVPPLARQH